MKTRILWASDPDKGYSVPVSAEIVTQYGWPLDERVREFAMAHCASDEFLRKAQEAESRYYEGGTMEELPVGLYRHPKEFDPHYIRTVTFPYKEWIQEIPDSIKLTAQDWRAILHARAWKVISEVRKVYEVELRTEIERRANAVYPSSNASSDDEPV